MVFSACSISAIKFPITCHNIYFGKNCEGKNKKDCSLRRPVKRLRKKGQMLRKKGQMLRKKGQKLWRKGGQFALTQHLYPILYLLYLTFTCKHPTSPASSHSSGTSTGESSSSTQVRHLLMTSQFLVSVLDIMGFFQRLVFNVLNVKVHVLCHPTVNENERLRTKTKCYTNHRLYFTTCLENR